MADDAIIDQLASNIAGIESAGSGDYAALGPLTGGDRAYGKYQIMGNNIPAWTREALGEEYDPDRFLADSDAQERTARFKMGQYYDQYGTPEDVASMWHAGLPYRDAVAKGRKDVLGTTTENYGARVRAGMGTAQPEPVVIMLPDGREIDLGPNPTPELEAQVKAKIRAEFPDLDTTQPAAVGDTAVLPTATPVPPTATPPSAESPPLSFEKPWRGLSVDEAAAEMNTALGNAPDAATGQYAAAVGKPIADALKDVYDVFFNTAAPAGGNLSDPATWFDGLDRALKLLHPLGVPAEIAGNLAFQALNDSGASPDVSGALATLLSVGVGAKTPVPGLKTPPGARMPLQGTRASRAAAAETAAAAEVAEGAAMTADAALSPAATKGPEAAKAAESALAPSGATAAESSRAGATGLREKLKEIEDPVKRIYDDFVTTAEAQERAVAPEDAQQLIEQINTIKGELGPTLSGQTKTIFSNIEKAITDGERIGPKLIDDYRMQLDTLFSGRAKSNASPRDRAMYDFKWNVRDIQRSMADDQEREWLEAADAIYRDTIIGKDSPFALGRLVKLAKNNPDTFVERVFGSGTSERQASYARAVMKELGDSPAANDIRESMLRRMIDGATDTVNGDLDPVKLADSAGKFNKGFYDTILTPEQKAFFEEIRKAQGATATAKTAHATADTARKVADKAADVAAEPNRLAKMTALGLEVGGTAIAHAIGGPMAAAGTAGAIGAGKVASVFIPRASLAKALADNPTANLLVRALKTPFKSKASLAIINTLRNRGTSVGFLGSDEEQP